jgi:hypothetical protein
MDIWYTLCIKVIVSMQNYFKKKHHIKQGYLLWKARH